MINEQADLAERKLLSENETIAEFKAVVLVITNWMAIPLYLLFWFADYIYAPEYLWLFLALRLTIIPSSLITKNEITHAKKLVHIERISFIYTFITALPINLMIMILPDAASPYYAGLNLVAIGSLAFMPFSRHYLFYSALSIYGPYFTAMLFKVHSLDDLKAALVNSFFIGGSIVICFLIRRFNYRLRYRDISSRLALKKEVQNRDLIIEKKTAEAIRLNTLSSQFSPQVVQAIREGRVDIDTRVKRNNICAIFVDIVNSTEKVVTLDQQNIDIVLSRFMDSIVSTFLKYDITIDKFQGDGILAFNNEPISYDDYISRICLAALEVRQIIKNDAPFYRQYWLEELAVRIGISEGEANVGFYGNKKFFTSYTAIGKPLVYAARLTSLAMPNQILIDANISDSLKNESFHSRSIGDHHIKGFGAKHHRIYELVDVGTEVISFYLDSSNCPNCPHSVLYLDNNEQGHFVMRCRSCSYVAGPGKEVSTKE